MEVTIKEAMRICRMKLVKPARRRHRIMRWTDPRTGESHEETTGTASKRDAYHIAADRARRIVEGTYSECYGWREFCARYEREHMPSLSAKSLEAWRTTRRWIGKVEPPEDVSQVDTAYIVRWQNGLRRRHVGETSIAAYSARLRAALNWAADLGIIAKAPKVRMPKKAKGRSKIARSRAITAEEFDRIVMAAEKVRPDDAALWQRFLRGLWHSGFRLDELLKLSWSPRAAWSIDTSGEIPCVRIRGEGEKAGRDRLQPITPEFWDLCCETPTDDRQGPVFPLPNGHGGQLTVKRVGRIISKIGKRARVVTDPQTGKCATSHDIGRRAFATRMEGTLSLAELQKWMRHASMSTLLNYYHHADAQQLAGKVWRKE
jgi:integrase